MATSAFKSSSRRGSSDTKSSHPTNLRRSHSVSAVSRKIHPPFDDKSSISAEFSVRRENPLFWTESSSSSREEITKGKAGNSMPLIDKSSGGYVSELRGRSITRNDNVRKGIGRSLSRVRGSSVSRSHHESISESGNKMDTTSSINTVTRGRIKKECMGNEMNRTNSTKNRVDRLGVKNSGSTAVRNPEMEWSEDDSFRFRRANLDDRFSAGSLSEAEEKTIKSVCEDSNVVESRTFQRKDIGFGTNLDLPDLPSNPAAVKLVPLSRQEYSNKLQMSRERVRKLREDLAIEERREEELGKVLFEITSDSNISQTRSRFERKASHERKRISKCLNEEALTYFDECVSLSTFDSSDFSASEDPSNSSVANYTAIDPFSPKKGPSSALFSKEHADEPPRNQPNSFSFSREESNTDGIRRYIEQFEKGKRDLDLAGSHHEVDEYIIHDRFENVFVERVLYSRRIVSGGLLLCGASALFRFF